MSLTIELSVDQEARITAAARQRGVAPAELVQELLTEKLPELNGVDGESSAVGERDPERAAHVRSIRGKYAHLGVSTGELHLERQVDKEREER